MRQQKRMLNINKRWGNIFSHSIFWCGCNTYSDNITQARDVSLSTRNFTFHIFGHKSQSSENMSHRLCVTQSIKHLPEIHPYSIALFLMRLRLKGQLCQPYPPLVRITDDEYTIRKQHNHSRKLAYKVTLSYNIRRRSLIRPLQWP